MGDLSASPASEGIWERSALERILAHLDRDAAPGWADRLIDEFGSIGAVMASSHEARARIVGEEAGKALDEIGDFTLLWLRQKAQRAPVLSTTPAVLDYLRAGQADQSVETVRVLYLNIGNQLLKEEWVARGTVDEAPIWPREIVRRALELNAASLIIAHNHPSGDPRPSPADINITRKLCRAAAWLGIEVHDHLVLARGGWVSMRAQGLLA